MQVGRGFLALIVAANPLEEGEWRGRKTETVREDFNPENLAFLRFKRQPIAVVGGIELPYKLARE